MKASVRKVVVTLDVEDAPFLNTADLGYAGVGFQGQVDVRQVVVTYRDGDTIITPYGYRVKKNGQPGLQWTEVFVRYAAPQFPAWLLDLAENHRPPLEGGAS